MDLRSLQNSHLVSESYIAFFEFLGARCPNSKINTGIVVEGVFFPYYSACSRVGARVKERLLSDHRDSQQPQKSPKPAFRDFDAIVTE